MVQQVATQDKLEYKYFPVSSSNIYFKVKCANDAHVALTTGPHETEPMYEIFIGGWGNSKTALRRSRSKPDKAEAPTPNILSADEYRAFWVRWDGGRVAIGREGDSDPILSWQDPEPFHVSYFGICTGWGANGEWILEDTTTQSSGPGWNVPAQPIHGGGYASWVPASNGVIPPNAVSGGFDNEPIFVGRAEHSGAMIPGKIVPSHAVCYVAWGGEEHAKPDYQVLCGCNPVWAQCSEGNLPGNALSAGQTEDGENLFVGRVSHNGSQVLGKVQPSHGTCYVPYAGQEIAFKEYEVLIAN